MRESKREMEGGSWAPWNERVREIGIAQRYGGSIMY